MIFIDHQEALKGQVSQLTLRGKLDGETAPDFENFVTELIQKGRRYFLVNVEELDYCSSAGIGALLYLQKKISAQRGMLTVVGASDELVTLFSIFGIDRLIMISENTQAGLVLLEKNIQFSQSEEKELKAEKRADSKVPRVEVYEIKEEDESNTGNRLVQKSEEEKAFMLKEGFDSVEKYTIDFESPLIVECAECGTLARIMRSGTYLCPECHAQFTVEKDQTVIF